MAISRLRWSCHRPIVISNEGFAYLSLLILVTIIAVSSAAAVQVGAVLQRREAEQELLAVGAEFQHALISYANATPFGQKRFPNSLRALLKDPRYPNIRRHLRKLYFDPLTGKKEWGLVRLSDGGIVGIYSLSNAHPIKLKNFSAELHDFEDKKTYRDWKFMVSPQMLPAGTILNGAHVDAPQLLPKASASAQ